MAIVSHIGGIGEYLHMYILVVRVDLAQSRSEEGMLCGSAPPRFLCVPTADCGLHFCDQHFRLSGQRRSAEVSGGQRSAVSSQRSAVSGQRSARRPKEQMSGKRRALLLTSLVSAWLVSPSASDFLASAFSSKSLPSHGRRYHQPGHDTAAATAKHSIRGDIAVATELRVTPSSRREILVVAGASWTFAAGLGGGGAAPRAAADAGTTQTRSASGRLVERAEPDERETYAEAQGGPGGARKRVLWVGPATLNGVYKDLFLAGSDVVALDLKRPGVQDLRAATEYANSHGYRLRFERGDATHLDFPDDSFDVVVSSMFLCQDFDPRVVVAEIRRVLKPGGRFGWYEHVEDIDGVIVGEVFGERAVLRVQAYPEQTNVVAGVVFK